MCIKKLFGNNSNPVIPADCEKLALLFGINNYPGTGSDLSGCLNDIDDVADKLKNEFPDFVVKKFKDSEVTKSCFSSEIENALITVKKVLYIHYSGHGTQVPSAMESDGYNEALYLYDGPFMDDLIYNLQRKTPDGLLVVAKFDSCFSGGMQKGLNPWKYKNRFLPLPGVELRHKPVNQLIKTDDWQKWVIFAGSQEGQTSADAFFNGRANGAFTKFDNMAYNPYAIYSGEYQACKSLLAKNQFDQVPGLSGPADLLDKIVLQNV